MNYKPSYGDKQRDAQKRRKQEQEAPHQQEDTEAGAQQAAHNPTDRKPGDNDKHAA